MPPSVQPRPHAAASQPGRVRLAALLASLAALIVLLSGCGLAASPTTYSSAPGATATAIVTVRPAYVFVAIGASETFGTGADRPATQNWPTDLSAHLPKGTQVVNLGIPGETAQGAVQAELPPAIAAMPNLITVWLGTNDIRQQVPLATFQSNLDTILTQLTTQTHAQIAVVNLPDLALLPSFANYDQAELKAMVKQWNAAIARDVTSHHLILLDVFSQTPQIVAHPDYISGDGLHPTAQGYQQIANFFYQVLHADGII